MTANNGTSATVPRPDLTKRTALSKSALVAFDLCQQKAWFSIHDPRPLLPSEQITFGSAIDRGVEVLMASARAGVPLDMERAFTAAAEKIAEDEVAVDTDEVERALLRFPIEVMPHFDFALCRLQANITEVIEGLGEVNGHPDVILAGHPIRDVKTAKRAKPVDEPSLELGLYALLVEAETGEPVPTVGYWTWVRVAKPYWQMTEYAVTDELRRWAHQRAAAFVRARDADALLNKARDKRGLDPENYTFPGGPAFRSLCADCAYNPANGGACAFAFREEVA